MDRLLYGERDDPYKVVAQFGQRLEDTLEPGAIPAAIAETVRASLRLPYAAITLELDGATEMLAESGAPASELICFPLINQGAMVGNLLVSPRRGDAGLNAADRALLTDLALQAGVAIHGVRLLNDLQQSRERLVLAREEERRRLRRDLHDDLAPTLAGLSLHAGAISDLILTDPIKAQGLADGLVSAIRDAVGDIRRLVYDLRPPALDDWDCWRRFANARPSTATDPAGTPGLKVDVELPETLPPLPAAVEVAAYRIFQEALMNVMRHAQAQDLPRSGDADGCADHRDRGRWRRLAGPRTAGVGLRSIQERVAELGGECKIRPGAEGGTRIVVRLPLPQESKQMDTDSAS